MHYGIFGQKSSKEYSIFGIGECRATKVVQWSKIFFNPIEWMSFHFQAGCFKCNKCVSGLWSMRNSIPGLTIKAYCFSEACGGKSRCDTYSAIVKAHLQARPFFDPFLTPTLNPLLVSRTGGHLDWSKWWEFQNYSNIFERNYQIILVFTINGQVSAQMALQEVS